MLSAYSEQFEKDIDKLKLENPRLPTKVWELIFDITKRHSVNPISGLGSPEFLRGNMRPYMSRKITDKHRLIYKVENDVLYLLSCYGHYGDR